MRGLPIRAIALDLDGTLIDSRMDIALACNRALARHGCPTLDVEVIAGFVGDGGRTLLSRAAGWSRDDPRLDAVLASFIDIYAQDPVRNTTLVPGALETLHAISRWPLALCTNKPRAITAPLLEALELSRYFQVVVAGGDLPVHKPNPEVIRYLAALLGIQPSNLVMVGDGHQDVLGGRAAGARTVGLLGGFTDRATLEATQPDALLASIEELIALLEAWHNESIIPPGDGRQH